MFNKTEESEWTRFSRALGGQPTAPPNDESAPADEPEEAVTLAQAAPVEPEQDLPPPPPPPVREPDPVEPPAPAYTPTPPPVAAQPASPSPGRASQVDASETVIGEGASIEGTVRSDQSIRVHGAVQGEIESKQRVVVEASAHVAARITADEVTVHGEVNGSIECSGRLEITSNARVTGEVSATMLSIQEGAFFEGNLRMTTSSYEAS